MEKLRKLIIKHFVLDYTISIFGKTYSAPRASRIIFPVFVVTGYFVATNPNYPTPSFLIWVLYFLTALVLYFGFVYFRFFPVKFSELDDKQKLQYGHFAYESLTRNEKKEWDKLYINSFQKNASKKGNS